MDAVQEVRGKIETAIAAIDQEREQLHSALKHLDGGLSPKHSPSGSGRGSRPRKRSRKRAAKGERRAQFIAVVKAKPGITVAEMSKTLDGVAPAALYALARKLTEEKVVVKKDSGYTLKQAKAKAKTDTRKAVPKGDARKGAAS